MAGSDLGSAAAGLCAFFELFRQLDRLDEYRLFLQLSSLLLLLYGGLLRWPQRRPLVLALGASGLLVFAGLVVGTDGFFGPVRRIDLFHALLTPAYPLLAWLMIDLTDTQSRANTL